MVALELEIVTIELGTMVLELEIVD